MRRKILQIAKFVSLTILAITITVSGQGIDHVTAGSSSVVVDSTSFATTLDSTKWNAPNGDIAVENGKIIISSESTDGTSLIMKNTALDSKFNKQLFAADYTINLKTISEEKQFLVAFGLDTIESTYGESGSVELIFENAGGLKASLVAHDDNGDKVVLAEAASVGTTLGKNFKISVNATTDMKFTVKVNGKTIYNETVPVSLEGRMGFFTTGACDAQISSVNIVSHRYDRPENTNITEDFESGTINVNTLTSVMKGSCGYYPTGLQVEEFDGNQVLMFRNVGMGYIGTIHKYSNFEISFDVPYMLKQSVMREDGTQKQPYHSSFVISFGDEIEDYNGTSFNLSPEAVSFTKDSVSRLTGNKEAVGFADKEYTTDEKDTGYSVKMTVIDGEITVMLKALGAKSYDKILTYQTGGTTPLGYVHLWSGGQANFAIDNLKVKNLDEQPKLVEVDYKEGFVTGTEDWEYEPQKVVYLEDVETDADNTSQENGFNWTLLSIVEVVAGIAIVAGCVLFTKYKKKSKKESVKANEG